jgi:hypothetical protein
MLSSLFMSYALRRFIAKPSMAVFMAMEPSA